MKHWITSDLHYGHKNIVGPKVSRWDSGFRDFDSLEDMNNQIVHSINHFVGPEDTLWFLGDWAFDHKAKELRDRLNVKKIILIRGNHDYRSDEYLFSKVHDVLFTTLLGQQFFFSHYAHRIWRNSHRGVMHCYGHSHHSIDDNWGRSMDVGWCKYRRPLEITEVIELLKDRKTKEVDHHV